VAGFGGTKAAAVFPTLFPMHIPNPGIRQGQTTVKNSQNGAPPVRNSSLDPTVHVGSDDIFKLDDKKT
jgi:hypothetical protein